MLAAPVAGAVSRPASLHGITSTSKHGLWEAAHVAYRQKWLDGARSVAVLPGQAHVHGPCCMAGNGHGNGGARVLAARGSKQGGRRRQPLLDANLPDLAKPSRSSVVFAQPEKAKPIDRVAFARKARPSRSETAFARRRLQSLEKRTGPTGIRWGRNTQGFHVRSHTSHRRNLLSRLQSLEKTRTGPTRIR